MSALAAPDALDFSGNNTNDLAVYNPDTSEWQIRSLSGSTYSIFWGWNEAHPVPGDYNADGVADLAVYDRQTGNWYIREMNGNVLAWAENWGFSTAHAVGAGDYDGDNATDLAVFDPSLGKWFIRTLGGSVLAWDLDWGWGQSQPVPGDYNGDHVTDLAVYDRQTGNWYIRTLAGEVIAWGLPWGWNGTRPMAGDFNGDGKDDLAVYQTDTGNWYIRTIDGEVLAWAQNWGWDATRPVIGDFDGDGDDDMGAYHAASGSWYIRTLQGATLAWATTWGDSVSVPVASYGSGSSGYIVVCMGDSLTYGRGSSSNGPDTSYPTFLDRRLETYFGGFGYVVNVGIPGEFSSSGRNRFSSVLSQYLPFAVMLMEGTNDMLYEGSEGALINNLTWMANHARGRQISVVMATMPPMVNRPFRDRTAQHQRVINTNPSIRSLAPSIGWPYSETYYSITSVDNWENTLFNSDQSIHPNDSGYRIFRDEFIKAARNGINSGQFIY